MNCSVRKLNEELLRPRLKERDSNKRDWRLNAELLRLKPKESD